MVDRPLLHLFQTQTIELTLGIAQVAWGQYTSHVQILPGRGVNYSVVHLKGISFLIAISHMIKDFKIIMYSSYVLQVHSSSKRNYAKSIH
jgi:hypothetical protein